MKTLRIATRKSPLALWQAEDVAARIHAFNPSIQIELIKITTKGDTILDSPLNKLGGKGLFIKELEQHLLANTADIAVHSMKDVTAELPAELQLPVILKRANPADAFVSNRYNGLHGLPEGARVGTSSLRRQAQLLARHPKLEIVSLRGNVGTRLQKLDNGDFDAIVLAVAGLERLQLEQRIKEHIPFDISLPAIGQGAIGIECRQHDNAVEALIRPLHDPRTALCVQAERSLNRRLQGSCQVPIAGYAELIDEATLHLRGRVIDPAGSRLLEASATGSILTAEDIGNRVADLLLQQGAGDILQALRDRVS